MTGTAVPAQAPVVRQLGSPAALAVADLAAAFEDMQTVLRCCERLLSELSAPVPVRDELAVEALWTTALLSYARCFAPGARGTGLTEADVGEGSGLSGEVTGWHAMLLELGRHYGSTTTNPRESFLVGAAQDDEGTLAGIAVTGVRTDLVDELAVRQTGAVAFALSRLIDERITAQQGLVFTAVQGLSPADLATMPVLEVVVPPPGPVTAGPAGTNGHRAS